MSLSRTERQADDRAAFGAFVDRWITPRADRWDREQALPATILRELARSRYLVATLPREAGGADMDMVAYGLLCEEIGRGCSSVRNLVAVQGMVAHALLRWGTPDQAARWVPRIGTGETLAAFALTEPEAGSDARSGTAAAEPAGGGYILRGRKRWISFGRSADIFLVFARLDDHPAAFLVERGMPGLSTRPMTDLLGLRASDLAEIELDACRVPAAHRVGQGRLTFDTVATTALDYGRYSTACGSVGLAEACLAASLAYSRERRQFGVPIGEHQLVRRMLTRMISSVEAARLLCREAGAARAAGDPNALRRTLIAKYFASTTAFRAANDAVQIHGANGCGPGYPVERYLRDAKVQEIIEGTSQIQELQIAELALRSRAEDTSCPERGGRASGGSPSAE